MCPRSFRPGLVPWRSLSLPTPLSLPCLLCRPRRALLAKCRRIMKNSRDDLNGMDQEHVSIVDVGAGEAGLDVAAHVLEERVAVVSAEKARRVNSLAPGPRDRLAISDSAGRIGRPVATISAEPRHPDTRCSLDRQRRREREFLRPSARP